MSDELVPRALEGEIVDEPAGYMRVLTLPSPFSFAREEQFVPEGRTLAETLANLELENWQDAMVAIDVRPVDALLGAAMPDDPYALSFRVTTANLNGAIQMLLESGGLAEYPLAYQALVLKRSRRELQSPPQEIRLSRDAFQGLPHEVQRLLMGGLG